MAKLKIKRKREWINGARSIGIYVDGAKIGTISNGQTGEFEIPAGAHTLKAKIDWCSSNQYSFNVLENEVQSMNLSAYQYANILLAAEILLIIAHFVLQYSYGISYVILFVIPFALCSLYYITFGHNKYLSIKEDTLSLTF